MREGLYTVLLLASATVNFYLLWLNWRWYRFASDMQEQRDDALGKLCALTGKIGSVHVSNKAWERYKFHWGDAL